MARTIYLASMAALTLAAAGCTLITIGIWISWLF